MLLSLVVLRPQGAETWQPWFEELVAAGRAATAHIRGEPEEAAGSQPGPRIDLWFAAENLPLIYTVNQQFLYASKAGLANNDAFQPITGNVRPELAFAEVLWWQDEARRGQIENVEMQR